MWSNFQSAPTCTTPITRSLDDKEGLSMPPLPKIPNDAVTDSGKAFKSDAHLDR
ncbi:hypothetical protein M378DRAFT_166626 [Amanita muscaria Koide BX008]|uniref:Uncharacterized protein n=1 Tax=Amanita muscaria (strain Koide BX008) TaxID=946122 RepID=A0A0C2WXV2_AMAMK|nr:hypothetical protein M378DRAFT_166626 [Amanita muscaria Koide BX008]